MIGRWSILYGSFAALLFFIIWTSMNWIVLLFSIEFLCVWQNKLYLGNIKFKELFTFDVGFLLLILDEFNIDFKKNGEDMYGKVLDEYNNIVDALDIKITYYEFKYNMYTSINAFKGVLVTGKAFAHCM